MYTLCFYHSINNTIQRIHQLCFFPTYRSLDVSKQLACQKNNKQRPCGISKNNHSQSGRNYFMANFPIAHTSKNDLFEKLEYQNQYSDCTRTRLVFIALQLWPALL